MIILALLAASLAATQPVLICEALVLKRCLWDGRPIQFRLRVPIPFRWGYAFEAEFGYRPGPNWKDPRTRLRRLRDQFGAASAQGITDLAGLLAGRRRMEVREEWRTHLSGETGHALTPRQQLGAALGFVRAALRFRLKDAADFAWQPVDVLLASRELSNLVVLLATLGVAVIFIRQGGLNGLADNLGGVAVVWGAAFGVVHVGRRWRDVKPPERRPRRKRQ